MDFMVKDSRVKPENDNAFQKTTSELLSVFPRVYKLYHELLDVAEPFLLKGASLFSYVAEVPAFPAESRNIFITLRKGK